MRAILMRIVGQTRGLLGGIVLGLALAAGGGAAAADVDRGAPAIIDATKLHFEQATGLAHAEGNVFIRYKDAVLRADEAWFNTETKEARAEGNVRLTRAGQEWVAPAATYNFATRALVMREAVGWVDPLIIRGAGIEPGEGEAHQVARATATTCDYDRPHYRLEATRSEIFPDRRVMLYNVTLRLGDVPVFWFPALLFSLDSDLQPITLALGSGSRWGLYALLSSHWQLAKDVRLTVHLDGRTERGVGTGADLTYKLGPAGRGELLGYYAHDLDPDDKADRLAGRSNPADRYRLRWRHQQLVRDVWDFKADVNKQSDADFIDDFFPSEFRRERESQTVVDLTRRGDNHSVSVLVRPQFNRFFAEVERLPEATWTVNRLRVGPTPLFYEQETRVGYLHNHAGRTGDPLFVGQALRAHTMQQLLLPQRWFGFLAVTPRAGIGGSYYSATPTATADGESTQRAIHTVGVDASFKLSGAWPGVKQPRLGVDGLRHIVQPFANFNWVPAPDNAPTELYEFDTVRQATLYSGELLSLTRYSPLEFPAFNSIDAIGEQQLVRFGVSQKLQTRRAGRPWDLAELTAWTDYRLKRFGGEDEFADLFGALRLRPLAWLALDSFGRYDMDDGALRELNGEARVAPGDRWSLGVGTRWLRDDNHLISFSGAVRLGRRWVAQTYQRVDLEDGVWESQEYSLRQETHDWLLTYGVRYRSERIKNDELVAFFAVTLKAFPGAGIQVGGIGVGD